MQSRTVDSYESWRTAAREALAGGIAPEEIRFLPPGGQPLLSLDEPSPTSRTSDRAATSSVPKPFLDLARGLCCHRDPDRFDLLYRMLWRITHGERHLLADHMDIDRNRAHRMERQIARAVHKTKAFVRFRRVETGEGTRYVAWHRPEHPVLRIVAGFFSRRFSDMHWTILSPDDSIRWDGQTIAIGEGVPRSEAPVGDELEDLWKRYYATVFNPARLNETCMMREMPKHHWATLPEAELIPDLIRDASARTDTMVKHTEGSAVSAADFVPDSADLEQLAAASQFCEGCSLYKDATQTVFGKGPESARVMFVGEQPGDQEDINGEPFVGPAGQLLSKAFEEAGIDRSDVYITNVVKHFKWEPRGKRRLHKKPSVREMNACKPWLEAEIDALSPEVLVCLGATAAQSLIGRDFRITKQRGDWLKTDWSDNTIATYHPSALLRAPDDDARDRMMAAFAEDLAAVRKRLDET